MEPVATTSFGSVRGIEQDGILSFRGIRYANAPTGERRWLAPQPADHDGDLDATAFGAALPQNLGALEGMLTSGDAAEFSEDALCLNVFTPAADDGARPVMVWIHGGAFETGSGHIPWYNGAGFAKRGVVVVTINYRLGALGFLDLGSIGLADAFPDGGNLGILDQVEALRWVQRNIASFGGDPSNVTIFGESAGAMSVGTLLGTPAARGLFHKAILQSGAAENLHQPDRAAAVAEAFVEAAGVGADAERLRALSVDDVLAAQAKVGGLTGAGSGAADLSLPWQPQVDGRTIPELPLDQVAAGAVAGVPLLIGTTLEEMRLFQMLIPALADIDDAGLAHQVSRSVGPDSAEALIAQYRARLGAGASATDVWVAAATDQVFRMPAIRLASRQAAHQPDTYMYLFTYRSPAFGGRLGAFHALEIPFVFEVLDSPGVSMMTGPVLPPMRSLSEAMASSWAAFAHDGRPAGEGMPAWAPYDVDRRATMALDVGLCELVDDPMGDERVLLDC